jgi:hypothetical protein
MKLTAPESAEISKQPEPSSLLDEKDEIEVNITIHRRDTRYEISILADGTYARGPIEITPAELTRYNKTLQSTFATILQNPIRSPDDLRTLAEAGSSTFKRVFGAPEIQTFIRSLMSSDRLRLQVTSEEFSVPWEIVYDGADMYSPVSFKNFWGMKYVISRTARKEIRRKPIIFYSSRPRIGLLTNNKLSSVKTETQFFKKLHHQGNIELFMLRSLDKDQKVAEFRHLKSFWKTPFDIAQIACHAKFHDNDRKRCYLELTRDFPIDLDDLKNYDVVLDNSPLVILNACGTGNLNPQYASNFTTMFLDQGAVGVVATECILPDAFAAEFTKALYQRFLNGAPLGECLLETRRYFLEVYANPAGLLYSMYAPSTTCLKRLVKS